MRPLKTEQAVFYDNTSIDFMALKHTHGCVLMSSFSDNWLLYIVRPTPCLVPDEISSRDGGIGTDDVALLIPT